MEKTPRRKMRRQSDHGTQAPYFRTVSVILAVVICRVGLADYQLSLEQMFSADVAWTAIAMDIAVFIGVLVAVRLLLRMVVPAYRVATR